MKNPEMFYTKKIMREELNDGQSCEMHAEDDKALQENNKKRTAKTHAQVQALEKFYNEHKYPTESMKIQLAESIGLTEKQVSGWFCHRRLKDKRLMNSENSHVVVRQDRSSGVIQDSCGSTKQVDNRNFDAKEVESEMLTLHEYSAAELTYEHGGHYLGTHNRNDDASSGSNSSLRNMSNKGNPFDMATSRYLAPKLRMDTMGIKTRPGPAGYLKVKGQVENAAITAVKSQLGKQYREDGPPLGVEFDPLPPGAFEPSMQNPGDGETCFTADTILPASPDFSEFHQCPKFGKGSEYNTSMAAHNSNVDRTTFKMPQGSDILYNHVQQEYEQNTTFSNNGTYHSRRNPFVQLPEVSARDVFGSESGDDYGMNYKKGAQVTRMSSFSSSCHRQPFGGNLRREQESSFYNRTDMRRNSFKGETIENGASNMSVKGFECHNSFDHMQPRQIAKDGKSYSDRRITNENQIGVPYKNDRTDPKRTRDEYPQQPHLKKPSLVDDHLRTYQVARSVAAMPSGLSGDEASAETSSSVE